MRIFFVSIAVLIAGIGLPWVSARAQSVGDTGFSTMSITLFPEHPGPNESVRATMTGFSLNVDAARIQWFHNGRKVAEGVGLTGYTFTTRGIGTEETIRAVATAAVGKERDASITIRIGDIDFLWRADTTAPPWYAGKRLASPRSRIIVTALPHLVSGGREIPASQLVYTWILDSQRKKTASGAGKQTYAFQAGEAPNTVHTITLEVSNTTGTITAERTFSIPLAFPEILFYEEHPLEGTRAQRSLDFRNSFSMTAGEDKEFRAVPFFFTMQDGRETLDYTWTINEAPAESDRNTPVLRLQSTTESAGTAAIRMQINNTVNILQHSDAAFYVSVQ